MPIQVLSEETINRIAAGEVVERPLNVAKELIENAIDAGATAISIEIRDGGISLIRVTDNGSGIPAEQIPAAFTRHATSKIRTESDLHSLTTLGFRGEALSSIAAVSQVEMITKTRDSLTGVRAATLPGTETGGEDRIPLDLEEIGAPDGTTVIVRNLFYNVPVRRKFLRQPQTEAGYITDLVEHQALSHPRISFHYKIGGQEKLHTTGNGKLKELIYRIYGREIAARLIPISADLEEYHLEGFLGRPEISRASRNFEICFVNGRMLRSDLLSRALEEGYRTDLMQHRFPFAVLHLELPPEQIDVNVHPGKMEIHFSDRQRVFDFINEAVHSCLHQVELMPEATVMTAAEQRAEQKRLQEEERKKEQAAPHPEPFEARRLDRVNRDRSTEADRMTGQTLREEPAVYHAAVSAASAGRDISRQEREPDPDAAGRTETGRIPGSAPDAGGETRSEQVFTPAAGQALIEEEDFVFEDRRVGAGTANGQQAGSPAPAEGQKAGQYVQGSLFEQVDPSAQEDVHILSEENVPRFRIIGQVFETYWLIEYEEKLMMIDQHAAHEKVNYERLMGYFNDNSEQEAPSQMVMPPMVVTLTGREEAMYLQYQDVFRRMGYEIEAFGGGSYTVRAVPLALYGSRPDDLLHETLEEMMEEKMSGTPQAILSRIATMSCKASVKGNTIMSRKEAEVLIDRLLRLDNPYHCPHGRPTMVVLSKRDMDRKFKRIV